MNQSTSKYLFLETNFPFYATFLIKFVFCLHPYLFVLCA